MEPEPKKETSESTGQSSPAPSQETPRSKLRDLRPEKDPMGAGRSSRSQKAGKNSP